MVVSDELLTTTIIDSLPEVVIWLKPIFANTDSAQTNEIIDFEIAFCNYYVTQVVGLPKELIIGRRIVETDLFDNNSNKNILQQSKKVWETGSPEKFYYYNQKLNRHYEVLRSKVGEGVLSIAMDVTTHVQTENKLKNQAALLNSILDSSINGVFACEAIRNEEGEIIDLQFLKFNRLFLELTKKTAEELNGKTYLQSFPSARELFNLNCSVIESGEATRKEIYFKGDGLKAWYDISLVKLGEDGLVVTFSDITEAKKDKEAIIASAQNLQNAIDSSQTGITVIVPVFEASEIVDFKYKVVNATFSRYIGRTPDEMKGQLLSHMFPSYKAQGTFDRYRKLYYTGESQRFDLHYVKDGYDVWVDIMAKKVSDEIFVTFHDYTTLKKTQLQLEAMIKDLKRSNANLEDFAYAASHDLQEPLRKIHFFSDKLKTTYADKLDTEGLFMLDRMEAASQRMRQLIDDLLVFSQINLKPKEDENIDLNEVVQDALTDLENVIQEKKARITTSILPVIKGNKPQLLQLFLNLISNSLKYIEIDKVPYISITAKESLGRDSGFTLPGDKLSERYQLIEVTDNGIGFDSEDADKIFNVFQRLHAKSEYSGTGVGLAIVKKVVDNHSGFIMAVGKKGQGATFRILLPAL
ncbi:MAG TPA: ATP-binding protein [Flavisolibacter sp.]|nr:ATP-binding protein [Flavisolibacter sp.]